MIVNIPRELDGHIVGYVCANRVILWIITNSMIDSTCAWIRPLPLKHRNSTPWRKPLSLVPEFSFQALAMELKYESSKLIFREWLCLQSPTDYHWHSVMENGDSYR
jgi:hypothetical protein